MTSIDEHKKKYSRSYLKMKNSKSDLIAYAMSFTSFVLPKIKVNEIILFGSVARGDYGKESDIDIFFDVDNNKEEEIKKILNNELIKFSKSKIAETWSLMGIKNDISIKVGKLDEWKLKRSIISEGIVLYGKYKELPNNLKKSIYINIKPIKDITKRNKIIRALFGRRDEKYNNDGLIIKLNGKKLTPTSFMIPTDNTDEVFNILSKEKIDYQFFEMWGEKV
jgi:predicted nucleotidyltransferase